LSNHLLVLFRAAVRTVDAGEERGKDSTPGALLPL